MSILCLSVQDQFWTTCKLGPLFERLTMTPLQRQYAVKDFNLNQVTFSDVLGTSNTGVGNLHYLLL